MRLLNNQGILNGQGASLPMQRSVTHRPNQRGGKFMSLKTNVDVFYRRPPSQGMSLEWWLLLPIETEHSTKARLVCAHWASQPR